MCALGAQHVDDRRIAAPRGMLRPCRAVANRPARRQSTRRTMSRSTGPPLETSIASNNTAPPKRLTRLIDVDAGCNQRANHPDPME
jgi:hypothetical protein